MKKVVLTVAIAPRLRTDGASAAKAVIDFA